MKKKFLMALALGLVLTLTPAGVLGCETASGNNQNVETDTGSETDTDSKSDSTGEETNTTGNTETESDTGEEKTESDTVEDQTESDTVEDETEKTDADEEETESETKTAGWNTVTDAEGNTQTVYLQADAEGNLTAAVGRTEIDGKYYFFDFDTTYLVKASFAADRKEDTDHSANIRYYDENGVEDESTGWKNVSDQYYYLKEGLVQRGTTSIPRYKDADKKELQDEVTWLSIDGTWYLVDYNDGHRLDGWQDVDGATYYLKPDQNGAMETGDSSGWAQITGTDGTYWYDFRSWGGVRKNTWARINNEWYYFHEDGKMQAGGSLEIDGKLYFFASWGGQRHDCLYTYEGKTYYLKSDGVALKNDWYKVNGSWYFFDETGAMVKNDWVLTSGIYYYVGSDGKMYTRKWLEYEGNWYYFKSWGGMYTYSDGFVYIDGNYYIFKTWGGMFHDSWLSMNGNMYYLRSWGGRCQSGSYSIGGKTYYFDTQGRKCDVGYTYINGYRYYRMADGSLCSNLYEVDPGYVKSCSKYITVDKGRGLVTIYGYNSSTGSYDTPLYAAWCSVGNPTYLTASGDYYTGWKTTCRHMVTDEYECWGAYTTQIYGAVYFHGVASDTSDLRTIQGSAFDALGTPQSHGCVRLAACDAKWIYQYCAGGTHVHIADSCAAPMPNPVKRRWTGAPYDADPTWTSLSGSDFVA